MSAPDGRKTVSMFLSRAMVSCYRQPRVWCILRSALDLQEGLQMPRVSGLQHLRPHKRRCHGEGVGK